MIKIKGYIVHFTEYNVKSPTKATVYTVVKRGVITFIEETEYCYDPNQEKQWRTDEEHYEAIKELIGDCENVKIKIPAHAASLIACFQRHGYEVFWWSNCNCWGLRSRVSQLLMLPMFGLYVVGNIHDNPELLKGDEKE